MAAKKREFTAKLIGIGSCGRTRLLMKAKKSETGPALGAGYGPTNLHAKVPGRSA